MPKTKSKPVRKATIIIREVGANDIEIKVVFDPAVLATDTTPISASLALKAVEYIKTLCSE